MSYKRKRIGILGAGSISGYHIQGLQMAGAEVAIIASRTEESARRKAQAYNIPHFTADYYEVLHHTGVDAILILTPDFTHRDLAIAAAQAGKAIYLQKPMARTSVECREIIAEANQANVPLFVSFMHRHFVEIEYTQRLLTEGAIGKVFSVRHRNATAGANWAAWFYRKENVGGGAIMQLGVHGIDLLRYMFGEIESVRGTTALMKKERVLADGQVIRPDNEDLAIITYRFTSDAIGVHEVVYNEIAGTDRFRMEIYGEKGTAWLRTERGRLAVYAPEHLGSQGWFFPTLPEPNPGLRQHRHFLNMLNGEIPPDNSAQDGLVSVLVAEAIYRSVENSSWEMVGQP